jgi:uncharacterized protein
MSNTASRKRASTQRRRLIREKAQILEVPSPRFVADVMLGRLAKWLRIAGFDVLYSNRYTDDELIGLSQNESRILLSRDTRLLIRRGVTNFVYLESEKVSEQIRQIFLSTHTTSLPNLLTRCLECNEALNEVSREEVKNVVPPFVFKTQPGFKSCPRCRRIYWAGTHRQSVLRTLESLL